MSVDELFARFPEIPIDLQDEPVVAEFADKLGDLLAVAQRPNACSTAHDAGNHLYLGLVGPLSYYGYGLATKERVVEDLRILIERRAADPEAFVASLVPEGTVAAEVKGPGCE